MVKRICEKKGFSLAEALIALTIVGIIAMFSEFEKNLFFALIFHTA